MNGHGEHESHAGITAEIRARAGAWMDDKLKQYDERLADRLDAAHKREIANLRKENAKLREALVTVQNCDINKEEDCYTLYSVCEAALATTSNQNTQED